MKKELGCGLYMAHLHRRTADMHYTKAKEEGSQGMGGWGSEEGKEGKKKNSNVLHKSTNFSQRMEMFSTTRVLVK